MSAVNDLIEQAVKRKIPLAKRSRPAVKVLIRWAIRRAEKPPAELVPEANRYEYGRQGFAQK